MSFVHRGTLDHMWQLGVVYVAFLRTSRIFFLTHRTVWSVTLQCATYGYFGI